MKTQRPKPDGCGSVRADEVMPLSELQRRFRLGYKGTAEAQRQGLRTIALGRQKFILGRDVLRFFERPADQQGRSDAS